MRVISFKVDDDVYRALKKKKVSFRTLFEPLACELAKNPSCTTYTGGIRMNSDELYITLGNIQGMLTKILDEQKKEGVSE